MYDFQKLKQQLLQGQTTFTKALPEALPALRGKIQDDKLNWLSNELQGYPEALEFYKSTDNDLPKYRIVQGALYHLQPDGNMEPLNHPYARRNDFFISAPIMWVEEASGYPNDDSLIELQEFGAFMAAVGGGVVVTCKKTELKRIIATFRNEFIKILDEVISKEASQPTG